MTWDELCRQAGSPAHARAALRERAVWRVLRGAYAGAEEPDGPGVRLAAARRVLPPGAVLSGRAALWVLGLDVLGRHGLLEVTLPRGRNLRPRVGLTYRAGLVGDEERYDLHGLLVMTPARVVVDAARRRPLVEVVGLGDAVLRSGSASPEDISDSLHRARGLRGVEAARAAVPLLDGRSESPQESWLRVTLLCGGVGAFEPQVDWYDEQGRHLGRSDLHLDGVVLEYDGAVVHSAPPAFGRDRQRHNALSAAGLEVRRFTAQDVRAPERVLEVVRGALRSAAGRTVLARRGPSTQRAPRLVPPVTVADRLRSAA